MLTKSCTLYSYASSYGASTSSSAALCPSEYFNLTTALIYYNNTNANNVTICEFNCCSLPYNTTSHIWHVLNMTILFFVFLFFFLIMLLLLLHLYLSTVATKNEYISYTKKFENEWNFNSTAMLPFLALIVWIYSLLIVVFWRRRQKRYSLEWVRWKLKNWNVVNDALYYREL